MQKTKQKQTNMLTSVVATGTPIKKEKGEKVRDENEGQRKGKKSQQRIERDSRGQGCD